jgi:hypothetical protein
MTVDMKNIISSMEMSPIVHVGIVLTALRLVRGILLGSVYIVLSAYPASGA